MYIICPVTEQIKKLCIHDRHNKVKGIICIRNNDKHGRPLIAQHIQLHFIIRSEFS